MTKTTVTPETIEAVKVAARRYPFGAPAGIRAHVQAHNGIYLTLDQTEQILAQVNGPDTLDLPRAVKVAARKYGSQADRIRAAITAWYGVMVNEREIQALLDATSRPAAAPA